MLPLAALAHTHPCPAPSLPLPLQDQGATVIPHQPSILQTAVPGAADRRLLRLMSDFTYRYSTACTVAGAAPPVMVHAMSNAGFVAFGTMLHLVGLLRQAEQQPGELAGGLDSGMGAAALDGGGPAGSGLGGRGGAGWHHFLEDPPALAVLSAFRQVLNNTQGIVIDSGKPCACCWQGALSLALAKHSSSFVWSFPSCDCLCTDCCASGGAVCACVPGPRTPTLHAAAHPVSLVCSALASHRAHLEQGPACRCATFLFLRFACWGQLQRCLLGSLAALAPNLPPPFTSHLPPPPPPNTCAAVLSEPAHGIEEAHPVLLPAARRLAERYFELTGVVQRIREVSRRGLCPLCCCSCFLLWCCCRRM